MASHSADDIAELRALLSRCCADLASLTDEAFLRSVEGEVPPGANAASTIVAGEVGPRWRPLLVGLPPGIAEMVSILRPPVNAITALLQLLSTLLEILRKLLIGIMDPFEALILAAIDALESIINDLLNAGCYLYYDAPGLTSPQVALSELGLDFDPAETFKAGELLQARPPRPVDNFERWAGRFAASFDDPGDRNRPNAPLPLDPEDVDDDAAATAGGSTPQYESTVQPFGDGSAIEAVFIVAAAPSLAELAQLAWLLGNLLNIDAFTRALDRFTEDSTDQAWSRVSQRSVSPDWHSKKLHELLPPLRELAKIPALLRGLLSKVSSVVDLLVDLIDAVQEKVQLLLEIAETIQSIIDLLEALQSAGLYVLPVSTNEGVEGLKRAFVEATNRPPGGFVAGACLLAAGPGLKDAAFLWEIFAGGEFARVGSEALDALDSASSATEDAAQEFGKTAVQQWEEMKQAIESLPAEVVAALGRTKDELLDSLHHAPQELYSVLQEAYDVPVEQALAEGKQQAEEVGKRGARSLSMLADNLGKSPTRKGSS